MVSRVRPASGPLVGRAADSADALAAEVEPISSDGATFRVTCDAPGCTAAVEGGHTSARIWPPGWVQDLRTDRNKHRPVPDYCPQHAELASA